MSTQVDGKAALLASLLEKATAAGAEFPKFLPLPKVQYLRLEEGGHWVDGIAVANGQPVAFWRPSQGTPTYWYLHAFTLESLRVISNLV